MSRTNTGPSHESSPTRRLRSFTDSRLQQVAESAQRPDLQSERADPPPQTVDTDLDGGVRRRVAATVQPVGNRLLAHDPAEPQGERLEQCHLARRQVNARAAKRDPGFPWHEHQRTYPDFRLAVRAMAAQKRANARLELRHLERLDQVVIRARIEARDPIL